MISFTVAVDYLDLLQISLPRNHQHFERMIVITAHHDSATREYCSQFPNVTTFVTDAFYSDGAIFNKWRALQLAIDSLPPAGLCCFLDADVILPPEFREFNYEPGYLYTPVRRMLREPAEFTDSLNWYTLPCNPQEEHAGYCQVFHADDPVLAARPWFESHWTHAGIGDSFFQMRWGRRQKRRTPFECVHLGPDGTNWCGRVSPMIDGTVPPEADRRQAQLTALMQTRKQGRAGRDFLAERIPGAKT